MIGWLMHLAERLFGQTGGGIRLLSPLIGTGSLLVIALLARRMFDANVALLAILLCALTPANVALNIFLTIDAPLVLFWSSALYLFWRLVESPTPLRWALPLAAVLGLGYLSKQMMLVFPLIGLFFLLHQRKKADGFGAKLKSLGIVAIVSLLFLIPPLVWNSQNDWITFQHTSEHFEAGKPTVAKQATRFFEFLGSQLGIFSPLTWILLAATFAASLISLAKLERRAAFLTLFSAPGVLALFLLACRQKAQPNWPAVYYIAGFVLLAAWLRGHITIPRLPLGLRRWTNPAVVVGTVLAAITYLSPWIIDGLGWSGSKKDPLQRLRGWSDGAAVMGRALDSVPRPDATFIVVLGHRYNASTMAHYMPQRPRVYRYQPDGIAHSQYEVWPGPEDQVGNDALIINTSREKLPYRAIREAFHFFDTTPLGKAEIDIGNGHLRTFNAYLARDLKAWPTPKPTPPTGSPAP